MLSSFYKLYWSVSYCDWGKQLCILYIVRFTVGEEKQLCFSSRELYLVLVTVSHCEIHEVLKLPEVVGHKGCVVSLSIGGDILVNNGGPQATLLGSGQLLVVVFLVHVGAGGPPLLEAKLVPDGTHQVVVPLAVGGTIGKSEIPEPNPLVRKSIQIESPDEDLP